MNILQLVASDSFIATNKSLIKEFGLIEANIIGLFASVSNYNKKVDDGWFYITYEKIEEELRISKHISSKAIEKLIISGILIDKKKGVPCRRYFKFQEDEFLRYFGLKTASKLEESGPHPEVKNFNSLESNNLTTSSQESSLQAVENFNDYNSNKRIHNKNKNNNTPREEFLEKFKEGRDVINKLSPSAKEKCKKNAPYWDLNHLASIYLEGIRKEEREPPKYLEFAFPEWCLCYTKGKCP